MNEEHNELLPDIDDAAPNMQYNDLKYPLLQRGIPIPSALEDYIGACIARDMLSNEDIETIRAEMLQVFQVAEQKVPADFDANFEQWFPKKKT